MYLRGRIAPVVHHRRPHKIPQDGLATHSAEGSGLGIQRGLAPKRKPKGIDASTVQTEDSGNHPKLDSYQDSCVLPVEQRFRLGGHHKWSAQSIMRH